MTTNAYKTIPARILEVRKETEIDWTFRLACGLRVAHGQFLELSLPGVGEGPISVSGFGDGWLELTIRRVGVLTNVLHTLKAGDVMQVRGPYGKGWPVAEFAGRHLIVAAGGTGLAPVRSFLHYFAAHPAELRRLDLLAGFKSPTDILFRDELEAWKKTVRLTLTVDKDGDGWKGNVGLVTKFIPALEIPDLAEVAVVVVGPPIMMKFTALEFLRRGVPEERLWLSFERRMQCGLGKCGHCKIDETYVCLEGPVFPYAKAKRLLD